MAAIIASVAPQETVTSLSGSTSRPHVMDCLRATALRSCGAPHVVAYWLKPSRRAVAAASTMRGSVAKSGKPCAKLIARSGPFSSRLRRVISRMTDSVKLWAFSDRRPAGSVTRIGPLQVYVRARAGEASLRPLEPPLPPTTDIACPARGGEEIKHVRTAEQPDHLAAPDHRHATNALAHQQPRGLVDAGVRADRDHVLAHDVARELALLGEDIGFRDDPDHLPVSRHHRPPRDSLGRERQRDLFDRGVLAKGDDVGCHHIFDRDHGVPSSLATVCRFALPPLRIKPVGLSLGSLPATYAAKGSAPVGSSAMCSRVHATRTAVAISSSVTVTISSTSAFANITSKVRAPIAVVRTPSAIVFGAAGRLRMVPALALS